MKGSIIRMICFLWLPVLFYSCSETKSLEEGQYLYDGAKIKIKADPAAFAENQKGIKQNSKDYFGQSPMEVFLESKSNYYYIIWPESLRAKVCAILSGKNWANHRCWLPIVRWKKTGQFFRTAWKTAGFLKIRSYWIRFIKAES